MYATVPDLRAEGVSPKSVSRARLRRLIGEASATIDRVCGQFFEPRSATVALNGRGSRVIELPWVPLDKPDVFIGPYEVAPQRVHVDSGPVTPGAAAPVLRMVGGGEFPRGTANVRAVGTWGHTEPDGTALGRVPLAIRRACMLLVMRMAPQLANAPETREARDGWRLVEERTRDQSYKLGRSREEAPLTGDPEVDRLLAPYLAPIQLAAA